MENIRQQLVRDIIRQVYRDAAQKIGEKNFLGVFLYGSQNYNLDTEDSDIDLTLVFIPDIEDVLIKNFIPKPAPVIFTAIQGVQVTTHWTSVTDFVHSICYKPSLSSIEYLCSQYDEINPRYWEAWTCDFAIHANEILRGNLLELVNNLEGQAFHYLTAYSAGGGNNRTEKFCLKALSRYYLIRKILCRIARDDEISWMTLRMDEGFSEYVIDLWTKGIYVEKEKEELTQWVFNTKWGLLSSREEEIKEDLYTLMELKYYEPQSNT